MVKTNPFEMLARDAKRQMCPSLMRAMLLCHVMVRGSEAFVPASGKERWRMRRTALLLASAALAVLFIAAIYSWAPTGAQTTAGQPNFVFILTDDMRKDDLKYMPKTLDLIGSQGMTFENAFVSNSLCCPSRATIMRPVRP